MVPGGFAANTRIMRQNVGEQPAMYGVDPSDDDALRAWHDAMYRGAAADRNVPLIDSLAETSAWLRRPDPRYRRLAVALSTADTVVGTLLMDLPLTENEHIAEFELAVPPEHRNHGYGTALLEHAHSLAHAHQRNTLVTEVFVPTGRPHTQSPGSRFALHNGYTSALREDRYLLDLPVDEKVLAGVEAASAPHQRDYGFVSWIGACPDEHLCAYAAMRTVMDADVPLGELDYEPEVWTEERVGDDDRRLAGQGRRAVTTIALDASGAAVGYSMLLVLEHNPGHVNQEDTLVLRAHRGHRLGSTLKLRNLRLLAEHFGDSRYVHTWTAETNGPMREINAAFGFRPIEEAHGFQRVLVR